MISRSLLFTLFVFYKSTHCLDDKRLATLFLRKYDYMLAETRSDEPDLAPALEAFQSSAGLPVTGELDEETLAEMTAPRCGVVDGPETRFHTYNRWSKNHLNYYIWFIRDRHLSYELQEEIFKRAFDAWSTAAPKLSFNRTYCLKEADIKITFGYKTHAGPGEKQCEKPLHNYIFFAESAHSFYPEDGRIHINEAVDWGESFLRSDLYPVALHEIGHALGLKHSQKRDSVMYPGYGRHRNKLTKDDVEGIRALYG